MIFYRNMSDAKLVKFTKRYEELYGDLPIDLIAEIDERGLLRTTLLIGNND